ARMVERSGAKRGTCPVPGTGHVPPGHVYPRRGSVSLALSGRPAVRPDDPVALVLLDDRLDVRRLVPRLGRGLPVVGPHPLVPAGRELDLLDAALLAALADDPERLLRSWTCSF